MIDRKIIYSYNIEGAETSGARFYRMLCSEINTKDDIELRKAKVILFNIYTPLSKLLLARLSGKKVVLRVDGLWNDKLNKHFLKHMNFFWRIIFKTLNKIKPLSGFLNHLSNLIFDNYKVFVKILVANAVVYQSRYCQTMYERYLRKKNKKIIINGAPWLGASKQNFDFPSLKREIRFCTIYSRAPLKGIYESVKFVKWLNLKKNISARLSIIGFNGEVPPNAPDDFLETIQDKSFVNLIDAYEEFDDIHKNIFFSSHFYLCLSRADPCPNALIESMAFGLPVIGLDSGGVPEIVGNAGVIHPFDDYAEGFFFGSRYEYINIEIPYEELLKGLEKLINNYKFYLSEVEKRFFSELDIKVVSQRYKQFLTSL